MSEMRLFSPDGKRLYLDYEERELFLAQCKLQKKEVRTFGETLAYTGCRISEALEITPNRIDPYSKTITIRSLKKRKDNVFRSIPVPGELIDNINMAHDLFVLKKKKSLNDKPIWKWTRQHAFEIIKKIMIDAGIPEGKNRTPKGLRHSYGVNAIINDIPLNMLQKWMGHADIKTTAIYANAIGKEEAEIASKMWKTKKSLVG